MSSGALVSGSARLPGARRSATASRHLNNCLAHAYRGSAQHVHASSSYGSTHCQSIHLQSRFGVRSLPVLRQNFVLRPAARRRDFEDDYVELDDEDRWSDQAKRNVGMIPSLARPLLLAANGLGNRLTDIAIELVPESVDRSTVALTLGTVVFGLYVAAKLWSKQDPPGQSPSKPARRGRKSRQQSTEDDGLSDVWFENKPKRIPSKRRADDSFW